MTRGSLGIHAIEDMKRPCLLVLALVLLGAREAHGCDRVKAMHGLDVGSADLVVEARVEQVEDSFLTIVPTAVHKGRTKERRLKVRDTQRRRQVAVQGPHLRTESRFRRGRGLVCHGFTTGILRADGLKLMIRKKTRP